jgi:predicted metal-dependent hydrolase
MSNFEYTVIRRPWRRTLSITISADNKIIVKASKTLPDKKILTFIKQKEKWINKITSFNQKIRKPYIPKKFIEGEKLLYLGKEYPLIIKETQKGNILFQNEAFVACIPGKCQNPRNYISNKLINWYKISAYKTLLEIVSLYEKIVNVTISDLQIKTLNKTWGSCSKKGVISFSWKLIMAPIHIIDYVVIHELCHLIHHNHSQKFWNLVKTLIPDYKNRKKWLLIHENTLNL